MKETVTEADMKTIQSITTRSGENVYRTKKEQLKEKFDKISARNHTKKDTLQTKIKHDVKDLTKDGIDEDVKAYLRLRPDFSETPKSLPYEKIIIETEKMCKTIEKEIEEANPTRKYELEKEIHTLREKVKKLLSTSRHKKIPSNLTKQEREGKKKAYADKERVYLPADKGKVMVAMDKYIEKGGENSYEHKMKKVLEDLKATVSTRANKDWDVTENV
jgi:hypothetical protein